MGNTPVAYVDESGIHVPDFPTVLSFMQASYRAIYGEDTYLDPDSQDGQFISILATAILDANAMAVQVYNAYSPATAQGTGLSSVVKINGIARKVPSRSTCDVIVVGQAGTLITDGLVQDESGFTWSLPPLVEIPYSGQIIQTVTCTILGSIAAPAGSINSIVNTQPGWQSIVNQVDATPGLPVETDPQLKARQTLSTAIPSEGLIEGLVGALWTLADVRQIAAFENDTDAPDDNGIPGHCVSIVIDGGDANVIATTIQLKKGGGVGTYGNEIFTLTNRWGIPHRIAFFRPIQVQVTWVVTLDTFTNYTSNTEQAIAVALSNWTNNLGIGTNVKVGRAYVPANLGGGAGSETFDVLDLTVARDGLAPGESDVAIAFNEQPVCLPQFVQFRYPDAP